MAKLDGLLQNGAIGAVLPSLGKFFFFFSTEKLRKSPPQLWHNSNCPLATVGQRTKKNLRSRRCIAICVVAVVNLTNYVNMPAVNQIKYFFKFSKKQPFSQLVSNDFHMLVFIPLASLCHYTALTKHCLWKAQREHQCDVDCLATMRWR